MATEIEQLRQEAEILKNQIRVSSLTKNCLGIS
jgi:hypothetical protein